jgi:DNA-binding MarR family transcriptional regulator
MTEATKSVPTAPVIPFPKKNSGKRAEDKWSRQVLKLGYTPLPNLLMRAQAKLKISPSQFNVLAQLCEHWWEADKWPYPAKDTIARRMGKSPRQIQRYITELEDAGLIERLERFNGKKSQVNNGYRFTGLIRKLKELEPEFSREVEMKKLRKKKLETAKAS